MAKDIYGNETVYTGNSIIKAQNMLLTIEGNNTTVGALVQNVTISYAQPIQVLREVGSKNYYYYAQLPQGSVSFGRLVSFDKTILDVLPQNVNGKNIWQVPEDASTSNPNIYLRSNKPGSTLVYEMRQCIVESLGVSTDANGAFVQEQVSIRFGSMDIKES
jgi:hypothetical protein